MLRRFESAFRLGATLCAVVGCSDPVPTAVGAALTVNMGETASCPLHGSPPPLGKPPPDSAHNIAGGVIYDGEASLSAGCSVIQDGDGFKIGGNMSSKNPLFTFNVSNLRVDAAGKGTGDISISGPSIGTTVTSTQKCTIQVVQTGTTLKIQAGAVWARYVCNTLADGPSPICAADGEFVFENCSK